MGGAEQGRFDPAVGITADNIAGQLKLIKHFSLCHPVKPGMIVGVIADLLPAGDQHVQDMRLGHDLFPH
ncbi:hypothetical protein A2346_01500 [candidate division WOR-1 bacterium RIFOXYB12_FULL_52_16]|nr:MAG: hypothetical protein A2346_01500 [candidate division WOR-1 bacterium RIFOXYB12_FULL_52_16]